MDTQRPFGSGFVRRTPYLAAVVVFLVLVLIWASARRTFATDAGRSPGEDWFVVGYLILIVVLSILLPRALTRLRPPASNLLPFAVAVAPLLFAFCAVVVGADIWTMTLALVLSGALLAIAARSIATRDA